MENCYYFCNIKFKFNNLIKIQHYGTEHHDTREIKRDYG